MAGGSLQELHCVVKGKEKKIGPKTRHDIGELESDNNSSNNKQSRGGSVVLTTEMIMAAMVDYGGS